MKRFLILSLFFSSFMFLIANKVMAATNPVPWNQWVAQLREEAIQKGIDPKLFDKVFSTVKTPSRQVMSLDRNQPEKRITFLKYRNTRADAYRITIGRKRLNEYHAILNEVGKEYGVSPCFILSLWGLESSYGNFMGTFPVIQSLATLAYSPRRAAFFRKQLFYALEILQGGHVTLDKFKGEWAGASGHPQFLPSSWHNYAVDYNGDGKKDIWSTKEDVFASIANYLIKHGWKAGEPWAIQVVIPRGSQAADYMNDKIQLSVSEWQKMGIRTENGRPMPEGDLKARLIRPDGGPDFLVFNNFDVIMKWNHSIYYAGTVGYMAEKICNRAL